MGPSLGCGYGEVLNLSEQLLPAMCRPAAKRLEMLARQIALYFIICNQRFTCLS